MIKSDTQPTENVLAKRRIFSGSLFLIAIAQLYFITSIAEGIYPGYSIRTNFISDLGVKPESATLWSSSMFLAGILVIAGSMLLFSEQKKTVEYYTWISFFLTGVGLAGVAMFNENTFHTFHLFFALIAFACGGISALLYSITAKGAFRYISLILGGITLAGIILLIVAFFIPAIDQIVISIGEGFVERSVAIPMGIWFAAFGAYIIGSNDTCG